MTLPTLPGLLWLALLATAPLPASPPQRAGTAGTDGPGLEPLVLLQPGFQYRVVCDATTVYTDGNLRPGDADGMGAFPGPHGTTLLCVNHELSDGETPEVPPVAGDYDPVASGGTSVMMVGPDRRLRTAWVSSSGTTRNCAGGVTPWQTWISAEESENGAPPMGHGWAFEVDPYAVLHGGPPRQIRLDPLGRFYKEAATVDPTTRAVYQTEDKSDGLLYRFMPAPGTFPDGYGAYATAAGQLEACYIPGLPDANAANQGDTFTPQWLQVPDPDGFPSATRYQIYFDQSGALVFPTDFYRGEGAWWSDVEDALYFDCTGGGSSGHFGQVWRYTPATNQLTLVYESNDPTVLDKPDNLTVLPWGDVVLCEDGSGLDYLRILRLDGTLIDLASTNVSEIAGACWGRNPATLYVNLQSPSVTLAIWGPWETLQP